jgi:hypothetical protein
MPKDNATEDMQLSKQSKKELTAKRRKNEYPNQILLLLLPKNMKQKLLMK